MITSKQRAYLRGLSNALETTFQIGKGGLGDAALRQLDESLEKRELIKGHVLPNAGMTAREALDEAAEKLKAEPVQCIGSRLVLYRASRKHPQIRLPN